MSATIKSIGKPTVQEADRKHTREALTLIGEKLDNDEVAAMLAIVIRPDRSFAIWQTGDLRRIEAIGLLEQAKYDMLLAEQMPTEPINKG